MALVSMVYMQNLRSGSFTLTHRVYQCIQSVFVKDVKPRSESLTSRQIKISKYQKVVARCYDSNNEQQSEHR